jgi:hypothetical protein
MGVVRISYKGMKVSQRICAHRDRFELFETAFSHRIGTVTTASVV